MYVLGSYTKREQNIAGISSEKLFKPGLLLLWRMASIFLVEFVIFAITHFLPSSQNTILLPTERLYGTIFSLSSRTLYGNIRLV